MIAAVTFKGIVGGKEKTFAKGDPISKPEANEMNLASKPHLTIKAEKDAKHGSKT